MKKLVFALAFLAAACGPYQSKTATNESPPPSNPQTTASALVVLPNILGVRVGQSVAGPGIVAGTTVYATSVNALQVSTTATGAAAVGLAVIPITNTSGISYGMAAVDITAPTAISSQATVLFMIPGVSVTMSMNVGGSGVSAGDSLTFYPTVTLSQPGTTPVAQMGQLTFTDVETPGNRLRRIAAAALNNNPIVNPPLTVPPAYVPSVAYVPGQIVVNNGNLYECFIGGTAGASSAPTSTAAQNIDGTVYWNYIGASTITSNDPLAPTITQSDTFPAGLPNYYTIAAKQSAFGLRGGQWVQSSGTSYVPWSFVSGAGAPSPFLQANGSSFPFHTDAAKFAVGFQNATHAERIIIDGRFYSLNPFIVHASHNPNWLIVDFSAVGGKKDREISIEGNAGITGVEVSAIDQVWFTPSADDIRVAWISDSIGAGSAYGPMIEDDYGPLQWGRRLGFTDVWNQSRGGTGYLNQGPGAPHYTFGDPARILQAVALNPDVMALMGSPNDIGQTPAAITAAVLAALRQIRADGYAGSITVFGVWPFNNVGVPATEAAVQAAVTQFADPQTFFIPLYADRAGPWITGFGNQANPVGSGNADQLIGGDGEHPNNLGINYWAMRAADAFRSQVLPAIQ